MQQRQLQLTQEQEDLLDECGTAIDELINTNPNINITEESLATAVAVSEEDLNTCSLDESVASLLLSDAALTGDPVEYNCSLDYTDVENGVPFNDYVDACNEAGGTIFVANFIVQCNFTIPFTTAIGNISIPVNFIYGRFNLPDCGISQDVQAACDLDLYEQSIASQIPQIAGDIESQSIEGSDGSIIDIHCSVASFDTTQFDRTDSGGNGNGTDGGSGDGTGVGSGEGVGGGSGDGTGGGSVDGAGGSSSDETGGDSENTAVVPDTANSTSGAVIHSRYIVHAASAAVTGPVVWWLFNFII
jgi:hypothetical protein